MYWFPLGGSALWAGIQLWSRSNSYLCPVPKTGKVGESVWRKYFLPKGWKSRMGGQLGLMLPTRRRRSQWWEPFLCCTPPRWISAWWLCYRNAAPTLEQNHHQRTTNATFLHIHHHIPYPHHRNLHPDSFNIFIKIAIINITCYQSIWWDFANFVVNPPHSLIPLQMALMSRLPLDAITTNHTQPTDGMIFYSKKIFFHQSDALSKLSSKSKQIFIRCATPSIYGQNDFNNELE